ncbi:TetR/AcrR family transcriptional regulator [Ligilactobacillus acidipiscis]|uniref:TetR/AcrR family transcriptional regulator n=1 Tax=Ligilactobacillus acidipiscis TaxID=89059 RepID=A0A921F9U9_9LACO|nr:TetR/AcrR family transcriptional regulator [Ligilactobacillus acidipiscis]WEV56906.1 TetR/AcrR family transcriptional regulator [Ligilactobacillus acidipiscis]HJE98009.1 TetR/AcrR family transcriptional regulator [Ligilactobacillus acidipiscis]
MLKKNKEDLRVTKTLQNIRQTVVTLLIEKPLSEITVTEIAKRAQIQRKTFYLHYNSVTDVLAEFEAELSHDVETMLTEISPFSVQEFLTGLNELLCKNYAFYQEIFCRQKNSFLSTQCKNILQDSLTERLRAENKKIAPEDLKMYAEFISSGIVNIYGTWFISGQKLELADLIKKIQLIVQPLFTQIKTLKTKN